LSKADEITMNQGERRKLYIIRQVVDGTVRQWKAAEILGMSVRQVWRLMGRIKKEGDVGIVHRSRGKISKSRIEEGR
jgi:DNA-binding CsgD family transcriptional regulator